MTHENEKIQVELHLSPETKQELLKLLDSKILIVRSIERASNLLHLEL